MPLRDAIQKILFLFFEIADGGGLLDERTEIFFHKSRDGGIPLSGDHAGPSVSFIINGNSDIFTISTIYSSTNSFCNFAHCESAFCG